MCLAGSLLSNLATMFPLLRATYVPLLLLSEKASCIQETILSLGILPLGILSLGSLVRVSVN